jgi:hypothetical protein
MKRRRINGKIVVGFCALLTCLCLLGGCETSSQLPARDWTPIGHSGSQTDSKKTPSRRASPQALSRQPILTAPSPRADYDLALVAAVEKRWLDILAHGSITFTRGVTVLRFTLTPSGNVSDIQVVTNTANEQAAAVCRKAILDPAPYPPWPNDMRRKLGDTRVINITFNYQ